MSKSFFQFRRYMTQRSLALVSALVMLFIVSFLSTGLGQYGVTWLKADSTAYDTCMATDGTEANCAQYKPRVLKTILSPNSPAGIEEAAKQVIIDKAARGPAGNSTTPNALQPAGLYAIPDGHERVKAAPKNCNLIDNIGESMGLGKDSILSKGLSSVSINTPYVSGTIGGCDPSVAPVLDGPGAQDGLELFKRDYKGNKYGSAMGTLAGWTNFALPFVSIIAIIAIIYAGFLYLTAFGNEEQTGKAKKIIIWVVVGIVIIISAYALVNTVISGSSG